MFFISVLSVSSVETLLFSASNHLSLDGRAARER
jgi:hypothetical protein